MVGIGWNDQKCLQKAEHGYDQLEMTENGWKQLLEWLEMAGNSQKWLEMDGNGWNGWKLLDRHGYC